MADRQRKAERRERERGRETNRDRERRALNLESLNPSSSLVRREVRKRL